MVRHFANVKYLGLTPKYIATSSWLELTLASDASISGLTVGLGGGSVGGATAVGFIRVLTAIEGLMGWILFGLIVYRVVSVKEDAILKEIHKLSNDQYLSRIRNFLFISNTNLVRFVKEVQLRKIAKDSVIYELSVVAGTNLAIIKI